MLKIRRVALAAVVLAVLAVAGGAAFLWTQGYRVFVIHTGSMTPTYSPGYLVVDAPARDGYRPGDVITFRHSADASDVVTHRITRVTSSGSIHTKGDGNPTADAWQIRPDQVRGRVIAGIPLLGYLAVFLQQPTGVGALATATAMIVLLWGLFFAGGDRPQPRPIGRHRRVPSPAQAGWPRRTGPNAAHTSV